MHAPSGERAAHIPPCLETLAAFVTFSCLAIQRRATSRRFVLSARHRFALLSVHLRSFGAWLLSETGTVD